MTPLRRRLAAVVAPLVRSPSTASVPRLAHLLDGAREIGAQVVVTP